jgi:hypothetical protein
LGPEKSKAYIENFQSPPKQQKRKGQKLKESAFEWFKRRMIIDKMRPTFLRPVPFHEL